MTSHRNPSILVVYPSYFYYPQHHAMHQIKSSPLLLASYLSRQFQVEYIDGVLSLGIPQTPIQIRRFKRRVRDLLSEKDFDILALSCWTSLNYQATMVWAQTARDLYPDRLIVVGGYHSTARPQDFADGDNSIDYIIRGEGEIALSDIARTFAQNGRPPEAQVITGQPLELDDFVPVNWDLVGADEKDYFPHDSGTLCTFFSRGCPFNCTFCMETMKNRRWRAASVDYAISEIQRAAQRFKFSGFGIGDACFGINARWRKEFLRRLVELKPQFWILFETRPEYLDDEDIDLLANIKAEIQFGLETGSPDMLRIMNKTKNPQRFLDGFRKVSHRLSDRGIVHGANLVFNHPGETEKTLNETFAYIDEELGRGPSSLIWTVHAYLHFPGSHVDNNRQYYEQTYGTRFLHKEWWLADENLYDGHNHVIPSDDLDGDRVNLWRKMYNVRDRQLRDALTDTAFALAAASLYPHWQDDARFQNELL